MLSVLQRRAGLKILLLGLVATVASAQEITGVVTEVGVPPSAAGLAVAGATVKLEKITPTVDPNRFESTPVSMIATDGSGAFRFRVDEFGTYSVWADKDGYTWRGGGPFKNGPSRSAEVTLDRAHPTTELHFVLVREAQLTGRLIDDESGQPVSGLTVSAAAAFYLEGKRTAFPLSAAQSDRDGRFVLTGLAPGEYVVANGPRMNGPFEMLNRFSEDDRKVVDQEYEWGFWPGGPDLVAALPARLGSGQSVDVGTLRLRKTLSYRVHVSLLKADCAPGETGNVVVFTFFGSSKSISELGDVPCGGSFLMRNFQPGTYWFAWTGERRAGKPAKFEVRDRNLDVTIRDEPINNVEGRIVAADGAARPPFDRIEIYLANTVKRFTLNGRTESGEPDANGRFRIGEVEQGSWQVRVSGLNTGFYVKEIQYDGIATSDGLISVDESGSLEVVVDDKPATLRGVVANGNDPVSRPQIVLAKWPPNREDLFLSVSGASGNDDGRFQLVGLAPGEYRILAVPEETRAGLEEPGVLQRLLEHAEKVILEPSEVQELRLKPVIPAL